MKQPVILFLILFLFSCHKGKNDPDACNGDARRDVKLLTDVSAALIDTAVISTTVRAMGEMTVPEVKGETARQDIELHIYRVTAVVDKVKKERDGDWHIRLKEGDNYLITECPNPGCSFAVASSFNSTFVSVKNFIDEQEGSLEGKTVTITGIGFVDIDHHYKRKQAKNNIELHPILSITY